MICRKCLVDTFPTLHGRVKCNMPWLVWKDLNNTEPDKRIMMIISNLHLMEAHSQSKLKMFLKQHKRSSLSLLTWMQQDLISLQCQLHNSVSSVYSHILSVCVFFRLQQHIFVKYGSPACWLWSLNTEINLWKMIFIVLLQRLPQEFLIWSERSNLNRRTEVGFLCTLS